MASRFTLPHVDISAFATPQPYSGHQSFGSSATVIRAEHGARLRNELKVALTAATAIRPTDERLEAPTTSIIEVDLRKGVAADALDLKSSEIRAGAAKDTDNGGKTIALYVPDHARPVLEKIIQDYLDGPLTKKAQNPPNKGKVEAIENIRAARIATLWTDARPVPEGAQTQTWWALWCFRDKEAEIENICERLDVRAAARDKRLYFHEVVVVPVLASRATIELMMFATDAIAELRLANDSPTFFTDDVRGDEHEWIDGLAERIQWPSSDAPAVCVLDTGINRGHALIEPALGEDDLHALDDAWGVDDHHEAGHGTSMAGLALHGDLTAALSDTEERVLAHRLESVKVLPPDAFDENEPRSYGVLTQAGLVLPEIEAPNRSRAYCMAVTNENVSGKTASSWSAAIDQAAAGCMVGDDEEDAERPRRLIFISAGNVPAETNYALRRPQDEYPIEDPAQAWNALSIGGYTDLISVSDDGYEDWNPLAEAGDLSPHSRTSAEWGQGIAPFKPDLVMEAGNRVVNPGQTEILTVGSLSLLTTGHEASTPLVPFEATSAATAQASRMAARLMAEHPEFWPETVRALMVHSAEWTKPMMTAIDSTPSKKERYALIRRFGYGVPDFDRANASATNHLAMMAQAKIQPFRLQGSRKFNECHYYRLPIPGDLLETLENEQVELKVTLSYFIDPNPGLSANVDSQRYQSHGLRFDLQRPQETLARFKRRVNAAESENSRRAGGAPADPRWLLGADSISAGSLHCDVWRGPAIELLGRNMLCVKPVNGWWRNRASADVCNQETRYSLIVSLKTANVEIDIHTPISVAATAVPVEIET